MATTLNEINSYLRNLLQPSKYTDSCPNGLQLEGKSDIQRIITGVTASLNLIKAAIKNKADLILTHHGFFWKSENETIIGAKKQKIKLLLQHDVSLMAYHLPLDAHPVLGNNKQFGEILNLTIEGPLLKGGVPTLVWTGSLATPMSGQQLKQHIANCLNREPIYIQGHQKIINTLAWCTGAAQNFIHQAIEAQVDAFITGEISLPIVDIAEENHIAFYAAGHHATERYGIRALGEHLASEFNLSHIFIDIDNPV